MDIIKKISECLLQIILILESAQEYNWSDEILRLFNNFELDNHSKENIHHIARQILSLYGGMNSLNDVVLYKNGNCLKEQNDKLDNLRKSLFNLAIRGLE
jgi:hypothetical protein